MTSNTFQKMLEPSSHEILNGILKLERNLEISAIFLTSDDSLLFKRFGKQYGKVFLCIA